MNKKNIVTISIFSVFLTACGQQYNKGESTYASPVPERKMLEVRAVAPIGLASPIMAMASERSSDYQLESNTEKYQKNEINPVK